MNSTQQINGVTVKAHGTSEPIPDASGTGMIEVEAPPGALAAGTGSEAGPTALEIAFLQGAKWWEWVSTGATMWQGDQLRALIEAARKHAESTLGKHPNS